MSRIEASEKAMQVCEEELKREVTPEEAKVSGISFELGRQHGMAEAIATLEQYKEQVKVLTDIQKFYNMGDMKNLMLVLRRNFGE